MPGKDGHVLDGILDIVDDKQKTESLTCNQQTSCNYFPQRVLEWGMNTGSQKISLDFLEQVILELSSGLARSSLHYNDPRIGVH